eukprot:Sspe_Gene.107129::Locus_85199_Transcript_1_1_Confidence_1.000_Length_1153::g.107129::m.107129
MRIWVSKRPVKKDHAIKIQVPGSYHVVDALELCAEKFLFNDVKLPPTCLRLVLHGEVLDNRKVLSTVGITEEDTLVVEERPPKYLRQVSAVCHGHHPRSHSAPCRQRRGCSRWRPYHVSGRFDTSFDSTRDRVPELPTGTLLGKGKPSHLRHPTRRLTRKQEMRSVERLSRPSTPCTHHRETVETTPPPPRRKKYPLVPRCALLHHRSLSTLTSIGPLTPPSALPTPTPPSPCSSCVILPSRNADREWWIACRSPSPRTQAGKRSTNPLLSIEVPDTFTPQPHGDAAHRGSLPSPHADRDQRVSVAPVVRTDGTSNGLREPVVPMNVSSMDQQRSHPNVGEVEKMPGKGSPMQPLAQPPEQVWGRRVQHP